VNTSGAANVFDPKTGAPIVKVTEADGPQQAHGFGVLVAVSDITATSGSNGDFQAGTPERCSLYYRNAAPLSARVVTPRGQATANSCIHMAIRAGIRECLGKAARVRVQALDPFRGLP